MDTPQNDGPVSDMALAVQNLQQSDLRQARHDLKHGCAFSEASMDRSEA